MALLMGMLPAAVLGGFAFRCGEKQISRDSMFDLLDPARALQVLLYTLHQFLLLGF